MEDKDKTQAPNDDRRVLEAKREILQQELLKGHGLVMASRRADLSLRDSIDYLQQRQSLKKVEPEVISEIAHSAITVGLRNLIELADLSMVPQIKLMAAAKLLEIGVKLKEMAIKAGVEALPAGLVQTKVEDDPWKFSA